MIINNINELLTYAKYELVRYFWLQKCIKTVNIGMTDCTNITYNFVTGSLNASINLFFSARLITVGSPCKSNYDRKYNLSNSHSFNVISIHLPRLSHLVEMCLMTFLISILLNFINSLKWALCFVLCRKW